MFCCLRVTLARLLFAAGGSVISLLVSSEFLQMDMLMAECLVYFRDHFRQVVKVPLDINCLSDTVVTKLSNITPDATLAQFKVSLLDFHCIGCSLPLICCDTCANAHKLLLLFDCFVLGAPIVLAQMQTHDFHHVLSPSFLNSGNTMGTLCVISVASF